jgi:hypothetical protein
MMVIAALGGHSFADPDPPRPRPNDSIVALRCTKTLAVDCSVCTEKMEVNQSIAMPKNCLGAGTIHAFHEHCLRSWFERSVACPLCRA